MPDDELGEPAEDEEDGDAEERSDDEPAEHGGVAQLLAELLHHDADAGFLTLPEELLADDGADDGEAGRGRGAGGRCGDRGRRCGR